MWCRHKWVVKEKTILPSAIEQLTTGQSVEEITGDDFLHHKPCIVEYMCQKCGCEKVERV